LAGTAFVLGGTGQIGRAVARRLAETGWRVTVGARHRRRLSRELEERGVRFSEVDRRDDGQLRSALGQGVDALVDVIAYERRDAQQLNSFAGRIGSIVAISSASVYRDEQGRSFDEAAGPEDLPQFPVPIPETQPTVVPGDETYSLRKVGMEQELLAGPLAATVLRPGAIHGPGASLAREWHFVKRVLDGRRLIVLADRGESLFHTTSVANLAELVRLACEQPGTRVLNCGDPDPPTALGISRAITATLGHEWAELLLPEPAPWGAPGDHPWQSARPVVLDMARARSALGYEPVISYGEAVRETCAWLVETTRDRPWQEALPGCAEHMASSFDYAAEDELIARLT
jgi:nucleoside-diphosphate-sugar epimerase